MKLVGLLALLALAGCASEIRQRADRLYAERSYLAAARLYDQVLRDDPDDKQARLRREHARIEAIRDHIAEAHELAQRGHAAPADSALEEVLAWLRQWTVALPPDVAAQLKAEIGGVEARLRKQLIAPAARAPLVARTRMRELPHLLALPELAVLRGELERVVADSAAGACARMRDRDDGPYLAALTERYCQLLGLAAQPVDAPPELIASLRIDGTLVSVAPTDERWLRDELNHALAASIWHAPSGRAAGASLQGSSAARFRRENVIVDLPWTEQVPYQEMESYLEPYTTTEMRSELVSYTEMESRMVTYTEMESRTVSYTTSESYSYSCGSGTSFRTCYGSRPVTRTRTESHPVTRTRTEMHPVTRTRTEMRPYTVTRHRMATRWVTRYRPEARVYHLRAERIIGNYQADLALMIDLGDGGPPLTLRVRDHDQRDGLSHDQQFAPAGVQPSRPDLPTAQAWFAAHAKELRDSLSAALESRWQSRFCTAERFTAEEAARCAHARKPLPAGVTAPLALAFGDDARVLLDAQR
jgi:hypothetical protein